MTVTISRYTPAMQARWDEFVRNSSNATFLHLRPYMDYHSDRFTDCSLMAHDGKGRLVAILPANVSGTTLYSHQGLTYGGWLVTRRHFATPAMLEVWQAAVEWMRSQGLKHLVYKAIPWIYSRYPADDDLYALWRMGASTEACSVSSAIPTDMPRLDNESARQEVKRAAECGITVSESTDTATFMAMLAARLQERHGATPVHSTEEMQMLTERFPDNIRLFMARNSAGTPVAGILLYITGTVVHTQYIASDAEGRANGAIPAIVDHVMRHVCDGARYLDFGTSCVDGGRTLNAGLVSQKYSLGGRPVAYTTYALTL